MSHIYIIYIYISIQCLSLGDPQRLKKPLKNGVLKDSPFQLRVLGWRSGGSPLPFGLNVCLLPSTRGQLGSAGETKAKGEQQGFGIIRRPRGVQVAAPRALLSHPGQPGKSRTPKCLQRGA